MLFATGRLYSLRREPEASEHAELVRWVVARSDSITFAAFALAPIQGMSSWDGWRPWRRS